VALSQTVSFIPAITAVPSHACKVLSGTVIDDITRHLIYRVDTVPFAKGGANCEPFAV
jgi:hypothetical protein